ncbi:MAG TPA: amidase [Steroidobacteraceae bacterium]|nr:amidase [Steroidobacteraceae bacterium]
MRLNAATVACVTAALATGLVAGALAAGTGAAVPAEPDVGQLQAALMAHRTTVTGVARHYLQRINELDVHGPALHAIIQVNPDALKLARELDARPSAGGILYGVPVVLKDNIETADALLTTAGSLALMDSKPRQDAFIVRRLRAAGALILAKSNLSEWANFRSSHSTSGWSGRGGLTRNPYDITRNACGSSSGSGAAVAADLTVLAVGTETDGSIVCPSSFNGLVGIKPTVGLVSRSGIIPISARQDTAGPMARSVADAAALLTVLAGYDPDDPATAGLKTAPPPDYRTFLDAKGLQGRRIGVVRKLAGFDEHVDVLFDRALQVLRAQGAVIVDPVELPNADKLSADELTALLYEFKDGLNRYLPTRAGTSPRSLAEVIAWNNAHAARELDWFGQDIMVSAQAKGPLTEAAYREARERARRLAGPEGIDAALAHDHLDALVAPTASPTFVNDLVNGDHIVGGGITAPPAIAGYPHITVPMGAVRGLPVGLSIVGPAFSEPKLIAMAFAYEQASHARRPPPLPAR